MEIATGKILRSTSGPDDPNFYEALILLVWCNKDGAMGFIINKKFGKCLNDLQEFKQGISFALYEGGPVDKEHLFFIHTRPNLIEGGTQIKDNIYIGGNFKQALELLNSKIITSEDIKIFVGYCGWDANQLENELEEGGWVITYANYQQVFATNSGYQ